MESADLERPPAVTRHIVRELSLASEGQFILAVAGFKAARAETTPTLTMLPV